MAAGSNTDDTRTILFTNDHEPTGPTHEIVLAIDEKMVTANEKLKAKAKIPKVDTKMKIQRFPHSLQGIGGDNDRYIVPSVVAIGPYHHGSPHLRKMEEAKFAAAYHLCRSSGRSSAEVYEKILSIVDNVRGYYDVKDLSVVGVSNPDFAAMMFVDGCFLLQYMAGGGDEPVLQNRRTLSTGASIQSDIFLLENQIPWLVLEVLTKFMPVDVRRFVAGMQEFHPGERGVAVNIGGDADNYTPPHLLGLLWHTQVGSMPRHTHLQYNRGLVSSLNSSSASELAEIGIKLTPSTEPWFWDTSFQYRGGLFGKLSLSPVSLNNITACWLVNMAALEVSTSGASGGYTVSSYLSVLAMLMDKEKDVQHLRSNNILYSTLSNKQARHFFNGLAEHLLLGDCYIATLQRIYSYRRQRLAWVATYRFIYKYYKGIAAVMSVAGVLFPILNALYSLKKSYKS